MTSAPPPPPPASPPPASPPPSTPAVRTGSGVEGFFVKLQNDQSGALALFVVLVVGVAVSYLLWAGATQPTKLVNDVLPNLDCTGELPGTSGMRTCAAKVAGVKMVGPLAIGIAVFLMRKRLGRAVGGLSKRLHPGARPLVAPLLATLLFLLVWAGAHTTTGGQTGIVPQKAFPAVIGVYTYVVVRYGPALQAHMGGFMTKRDRLPMWARVLITVAVPTVVSLLITNQDRVSDTAQKEQFVVLIGLTLAFLMLSPRGGLTSAPVQQPSGAA